VRVRVYAPLFDLARQWPWVRRNHRKILVVDGVRALVGGINVSFGRSRGGEAAHWEWLVWLTWGSLWENEEKTVVCSATEEKAVTKPKPK
jgi:hypothetical protein